MKIAAILTMVLLAGCASLKHEQERLTRKTVDKIIEDRIAKAVEIELPNAIEKHVGAVMWQIIPMLLSGGGAATLLGMLGYNIKKKNGKKPL